MWMISYTVLFSVSREPRAWPTLMTAETDNGNTTVTSSRCDCRVSHTENLFTNIVFVQSQISRLRDFQLVSVH